jgi:hypothetical protein
MRSRPPLGHSSRLGEGAGMDTASASIDLARLDRERDELRARFDSADPIRHVVIDGFLDAAVAARAVAAFPDAAAMAIAFADLAEVKSAEQRLDRLDPIFRAIFDELASARFVTWLEQVTGIAQLVCDPALHGGGLHQGADGSYLDVHADFNIHPALGLYRRLNVLIYLNPVWQPAWQGYLELWSRDMGACRQLIEPAFNRCVIMETHDQAFHGYKELRLPAGVTRRSLAMYYYAEHMSSKQTEVAHDTIFHVRPDERRATGVRKFLRRVTALAPAPARAAVRAVRRTLHLD